MGAFVRKSRITSLVAIVFWCGVSTVALAAKKPAAPQDPPAPPTAYSWTGLYVGGTVGGAWTTNSVTQSTAGGTLYVPSYYPGLAALGSPNLSGTSAIVGAKIGYNWQFNPVVVLGIEADISSFHFNQSASATGNSFLVPPTPGFTSGLATFNTNASTTWLSTVRARAGYAIDRVLFYGTGGAAFTNLSFSNNYSAHSPAGIVPNDVEAVSSTQTKTGWAAGGGIDYNIAGNWIVSLEYLYVAFDFGTVSAPVVAGNGNTATFSYSNKLQSNIVRAGLSYKF